ncbi:MAG: flagellar biosynthesis anti-sigma factor FlgM [Chthonomonadales bacterium]
MKISLQEVERILRTQEVMRSPQRDPASAGAPEISTPSGAATVEISAHAIELLRARKAVEEAPDAREELVAELKAKIDSGTYNVTGEDIADLMVRRAYADRIR